MHKTLFDHRPFASGEINYLIKSNDPLITQIESSISTSVTLIKEEQSDKQSQVQEFVQSCHLQKLSSKSKVFLCLISNLNKTSKSNDVIF